MDLYCKRCGEPWEYYYVQHEITPQERTDFHAGKGCPSCAGKVIEKQPFRAVLADALGDILGDDLDGLAAEMEDVEQILGAEFWE